MPIVKAVYQAWRNAVLTIGTGMILAAGVLLVGPALYAIGVFVAESLIPPVSDFSIQTEMRTRQITTAYDRAGQPHQIPIGTLFIQGRFYKRHCEFIDIVWLTRGSYGWRISDAKRYGLAPGSIQNRPQGWQEFAWYVVPSPEAGDLSQIVAKHKCGDRIRTTVLYEGRIEEAD